MRWDRGYKSNNIDDRRSEGPARGFGGGGLGGLNILALAARFGWKGILVALVLIGAMLYGPNMCSGASNEKSHQSAVPTAPQKGDDASSFVGFVLDDVQRTFAREVPGMPSPG